MNNPFAPLQGAQGDDYHSKQSYAEFDMQLADQIYEYYHYEPTLRMCRDLRYAHDFRGGMEAVVNGQSVDLVDILGNEMESVSILRRASDFRDMFGFCPLKRYRDLLKNEYRFSIPEFGTGKFVALLDKKTMRAVVYFIPNKQPKGRQRETPVKGYDPAFQVFIFPGKEPVWRARLVASQETQRVQFGSKIYPLFQKYSQVKLFWQNQIDGDWEATHPMQYTTHRAETGKLMEMTEPELYGDISVGNAIDGAPHNRNTYQRNVLRAVLLEMALKETQRRNQSGDGGGQADMPDSSGKLVSTQIARKELDKTIPLPIGDDLARATLPDARRNVGEIEELYNELLCLVMGIPRNFFRSKGKFQANVEEDIQVLRTTITQDREDANVFFQFMYELGHREEDDRYLSGVMVRGDKLKKEAKKLGNSQAVAIIKGEKRKAKTLLQTPFRAELRFLEDPFLRQVDVKLVQVAAASRAISAEEEINFFRTRLSLEKVEPNDKLVLDLERKRKRETEIEQQKLSAMREQPKRAENGQPAAKTDADAKEGKEDVKLKEKEK